MKELLARCCDSCPLCVYARNNPETWFGKLMEWHGKWCPFWSSWKKVYGQNSSPGKPAGDSGEEIR